MMLTADTLLAKLPPFKDEWVLVKQDQKVNDIIRQVLAAHEKYAGYYDKIALYFDADTIDGICDNLYRFCKKEIRYREEKKMVGGSPVQTTALPAGILSRKEGDCKHYAGFCGGVLDAIRRLTGKKINWCYRFASYKILEKTPHHVFVVVKDGKDEIWIDPVPGSGSISPNWQIDKKSNIGAMPLYDNIGFIPKMSSGYYGKLENYSTKSEGYHGNSIGWTMETTAGYTTSGPAITPRVGHPYFGSDYLGLSRYGLLAGTDLNALTGQLQAIVNKSANPYTIDPELVNKVATENIQNWNFYYPKGTSPRARGWVNDPDLQNFLMLTVTADGRLTFDRDAEPPHDAPQIHKLVDWANYLVQAYSDKPYIVTIEHLKRLGKGWHTPEEGSLWHVIHTGDVNFTKVADFIEKIPGLKQLAAAYGINLNSLMGQAEKYLAGGADVGLPTGTDPYGSGTGISGNPLLYAALIGGAAYFIFKKPMIAAAVGLGSYWLLTKTGQPATLAA